MHEPYIDLNVSAHLKATTHLTMEQHGAYLLLLMELKRQRGEWLPLDHDQLARLCRVSREQWDEIWPALEGYFQVSRSGRLSRKETV